jgi:hypothetical protein
MGAGCLPRLFLCLKIVEIIIDNLLLSNVRSIQFTAKTSLDYQRKVESYARSIVALFVGPITKGCQIG